jgi:hypothetical protein
VGSGGQARYGRWSASPDGASIPRKGRPRMASIVMGGLVAVPLMLLLGSVFGLGGRD